MSDPTRRRATGETITADFFNELVAPETIGSTLLDDFREGWTSVGGAGMATVYDSPRFPVCQEMTVDATFGEGVRKNVSAFDLQGRFLSFWVRRTSANWQSLTIALWVNGNTGQRFEGTIGVTHFQRDRWHLVTVRPGTLSKVDGGTGTVPGPADLANVTRIDIGAKSSGAGLATTVRLAELRLHDNALDPGVIWAFDDSTSDHYTVAFPALSAAGYRGANAVIPDNGSTGIDQSGYMTTAQAQELYDAGWEFNGHGIGALPDNNAAGVRANIQTGVDFLRDNGWLRGAHHWVYVGGHWTPQILQEVARHVRSGRVVSNGCQATPFVADRMLLGSYYITSGTALATVQAALDDCLAYGHQQYLTFHHLVATVSANEDWLASDFEALVTYAQGLGLVDYLPHELWPEGIGGVSRGMY